MRRTLGIALLLLVLFVLGRLLPISNYLDWVYWPVTWFTSNAETNLTAGPRPEELVLRLELANLSGLTASEMEEGHNQEALNNAVAHGRTLCGTLDQVSPQRRKTIVEAVFEEGLVLGAPPAWTRAMLDTYFRHLCPHHSDLLQT
ncbi:MAG: hypothetical protein OXF41_11010 [bacterium]|nr:hypothetical protein [bacterium]